tara:strand:- start:296 stop:547 length:252 start_codon:yes stop_codon:yes gene_type:complete
MIDDDDDNIDVNVLIENKKQYLIEFVEIQERLDFLRKENKRLDKLIWKKCDHDWVSYDGYRGFDSPKHVCSKCKLFDNSYFYT